MTDEREEYELALRAREGDREALAALVERTRLRLFALAYAELRHYDDAQDAVAGALLQICRHVTELREPARVRAWMHSIVRNEVRRLCRGPHAPVSPLDALEPTSEDAAPSVLRLDVERALRSLPGEQARALRLFYLADLSIAEIAGRIGRSEGTVKSWLHRGRRHLAAHMQEYAPMTPTRPTETAAIVHTDLAPALVRKLREALRSAGYQPKVIKPDDLSRLPGTLKGYNLVLVDEWLHGRPALEILLHLKGAVETATIPVFLLVASPSDFTASAWWLAGADRLINKDDPSEIAMLGERAVEATSLPEVLPVLAVRDKVYFPGMQFPLFIGRARTVAAVNEAQRQGRYVFITAQKQMAMDLPGPDDLYDVGVAARVQQVLRLPDGTLRVMIESAVRVRVLEYLRTDPFMQVRIEVLTQAEDRSEEPQRLTTEAEDVSEVVKRLLRTITEQMEQLAERNEHFTQQVLGSAKNIDDPGRLADSITPYFPLKIADQQEILETLHPRERLEKLSEAIRKIG